MTLINKFRSGVTIFLASIMLFSCNLEDFNLKKLVHPEDIVPVAYSPLVYGTFMVKDLVTTLIPSAFTIPATGMSLDSVLLDKTGVSFRSSKIDSIYLVTHFSNNTPADFKFNMSFTDKTGLQIGNSFTIQKVLPDSIDQKTIFPLGLVDQDNLQYSTFIKLKFMVSSPAGVPLLTYGGIRSKIFSVKISFYAPVHL